MLYSAPERVVEAALRQAALQRHLAALVARRRVAAGARAAALVAAAGGLAVPGARVRDRSRLRFLRRARSGRQITQVHLALHLDQVARRRECAQRRRVVVHDHRLADARQPERRAASGAGAACRRSRCGRG